MGSNEKILFQSILLDQVDFDFNKIYEKKESYAAMFKMFSKCVLKSNIIKTFISNTPNTEDDESNELVDKFNEIYTPAQEAFLYAVLDNNLARWKVECGLKLDQTQNSPDLISGVHLDKAKYTNGTIPPFKYTNQRSRNKNLTSGWTPEGIMKYDQLFQAAQVFRNSKHYKRYVVFTHDHFNHEVVENNDSTNKKRKFDVIERQKAQDNLDAALDIVLKRSVFL